MSPVNKYMLEVNNKNIREKCEFCSKLSIKSPERCEWRRLGVFNVNYEHISQIFLVFYCWL